jgi:hypothetical protein
MTPSGPRWRVLVPFLLFLTIVALLAVVIIGWLVLPR